MTQLEKAYGSLRRGIVCGELEPGSPLRLAALGERYGVGFSPLREALNRLHGERLVELESLRGFRVAPISLAAMWDTINTRILTETEALRLSIASGGDDWEDGLVAALHALTRQASRATGGGDGYAALEDRHLAFHRALIAACGSDWLLDFSERLYVGAERYRYPALIAGASDSQRDIAREHSALAEAALARDADAAAALLSDHYRRTGDFIERTLGERLDAGQPVRRVRAS